jgi:hypothetical protein
MRGRKALLLTAALFAFSASAQQVDTTGVWYHLRHHDVGGAKTELQRLQEENPGWVPPKELTDAFSPPKAKPAPAASRSSPQGRKVDEMEAAIYAGRIDANKIEALSVEMRKRRDARGAEKIGRALLVRDRPELARGWMERAVNWSRPGSELHSAAVTGLAKSEQEIARLSAEQAAKAARKDIDLGWAALDAHDPKRAATYFAAAPQTEESRYGLILALSQSDAELDAACAPDGRSPRMEQACGDGFAERALAAYRAEKWDVVIALDARAHSLGLARSGTGVLTGWSHFRQGDYAAALQSFDAASAEPDAVAGIAQSLIALYRFDELAQRAATNPALAGPYRDQVGQLALIRQRATLAASVGAPGTAGYAAPSVSIGVYDRDKSGGVGADKIAELGASLTVQGAVGRDQFSGGVESGHLGTGSGGQSAMVTTPWAKWERQNIDDDYSLTLGTSPLSGAVGALPALGLGGEKDWQSIIGTVGFKVQPRYDSLLSEAGMRDPVTGATWGRVMEIGPQLGAVLLATEKLALSGSLAAATLQGHDVESNSRVSANLSASYSLEMGGFDYLRVGPFYGFDAYDKNENFFTPGAGGYYSPQASHSLGAFADFLTSQGKSWLLGGRIGGSWQYARQSGEATETQLGTDATLRGGVLLGHGVILGAFGRVTVSPSGRDKAAGLTLTMPLSGREGVFSADLPHFIDRSWP